LLPRLCGAALLSNLRSANAELNNVAFQVPCEYLNIIVRRGTLAVLCEGAEVAIYRLLQGSAFEPDDIVRMTTAYEKALILLGLRSRTDPLTELVAKYIVEIAQTGEKDFETICTLAIERLKNPDREAC
jgi:hypothetical protein